jgi:hypothetical protein
MTGIALVVALSVSPGAAVAKDSIIAIGPSQTTELRLKGSNGYSISVTGSRGKVSLTAKRGGASAAYSTHGVTSATRIKARFGDLGRISMRFHSERGPKSVPAPEGNCRGGGETVDDGHWVGRIEFEGEQAYTKVHVSRARGTVTKTLKQTCKPESESGHASHTKITILTAASKESGIFVIAARITSRTRSALDVSVFNASILELHGRTMSVTRSVTAIKNVGFTSTGIEGRIDSVTIAPPVPFTGTATFQRTSGTKGTWSGSLVGNFPGRGEVALAGPEFSAELQG